MLCGRAILKGVREKNSAFKFTAKSVLEAWSNAKITSRETNFKWCSGDFSLAQLRESERCRDDSRGLQAS